MAADQTVAIVSSAISPSVPQISGTDVRLIPPEVRLAQTRDTISSLTELGIDCILVSDGSGENWDPNWSLALAPARVFVQPQGVYTNKGILEIYLLLSLLPTIPSATKILKLSGRYTLSSRLDSKLADGHFVFKRYRGRRGIGGVTSTRQGMGYPHVSTVAYAVRDKEVLHTLLVRCLREVFGYQTRIVGLRSLFRLIRNSVFPYQDTFPYHDPPISIELAMLRALSGLNGTFVEHLGIAGISGQNGAPYRE